MWLQIPALGVLAVCLYLGFRDNRLMTKKEQALCFHLDMICKLKELIEDPTMTEQKWLEWVDVFAYADDEINRVCGAGTAHLAEKARGWARGESSQAV